MKEIDSKELRKILVEILDYVDRFCEKNNISYYIVGGTLIGAVRHHGFIPWDDDIDICMLRADYDRFVELFEKENNEIYKIYSPHNIANFPTPYAKVGNSKTGLSESLMRWSDFDLGVNIDIFPFDTIPEDVKLQKRMYKTFKFYQLILQLKQLQWGKHRPLYKNIGVVILKQLLKVIPYSFITRKMIENALQYQDNESSLCGNVVWGYGMKEISKKGYFSETLRMEFEGRMYPVFKGYDAFLRQIYGDYMQLPPEEKRVSNHGSKAWWK